MGALLFEPIYQERVWGGRGLEEKLGRTLPGKEPYGESWEVVDRTEAQSIVASGPDRGRRLRELIEQDTARIMGEGWDPKRPFPILVKWLDCQERLSLQVHPPADVAPELNGEPKTENWFIAETNDEAHLIAGLKAGVTREQFESALRANELEPLVHRFPVGPGDHIFVPSGRIHAIDGGNLILEIQQNSDTTYRVYDWGRVGLDNKPRQLHIEESLRSIAFDDFEPDPGRAQPGNQPIAECQEFRIRKFEAEAGASMTFPAGEEPRLIGVVNGSLRDERELLLGRGANALLPAGETTELEATEVTTFLVTDHFAS